MLNIMSNTGSKGKAKAGKSVSIDEHNKLKQWYAEELQRKDKMIDELREKNEILVKTALKAASERIGMEKAKVVKKE